MAEDKVDVGKVKLTNVRLSFCDALFLPKSVNGGNARYSSNFLMDPNTPEGAANIKKLKAAAVAKMREKYGDDQAKWPKIKPANKCLRDGDEENWDGYAGHMYLSTSNRDKPKTVDRNPKRELKQEDGRLYAGCYVNAVVKLWIQQAKTIEDGSTIPNRINASLEAVQFYKDGEAFGARPVDPNEEFDDLSDDDSDLGDIDPDTGGDDDVL